MYIYIYIYMIFNPTHHKIIGFFFIIFFFYENRLNFVISPKLNLMNKLNTVLDLVGIILV
jgi:hypothetical protein